MVRKLFPMSPSSLTVHTALVECYRKSEGTGGTLINARSRRPCIAHFRATYRPVIWVRHVHSHLRSPACGAGNLRHRNVKLGKRRPIRHHKASPLNSAPDRLFQPTRLMSVYRNSKTTTRFPETCDNALCIGQPSKCQEPKEKEKP